jgi:DNA-binding transcriptional MerR regulator
MPELLNIGEVAEQAHVATSTIRYYERRSLLNPDARQSGRRRYRTETLRRLVFIGMLQDAGLSLDDIDGILNAATVAEWKAIAGRRLEILDEHGPSSADQPSASACCADGSASSAPGGGPGRLPRATPTATRSWPSCTSSSGTHPTARACWPKTTPTSTCCGYGPPGSPGELARK